MAHNWTPDLTMSKQNSKVRVNFSDLQKVQAEFLVCSYLNRKNSKVRVNFSGRQTKQAEFLVCNYLNRNYTILCLNAIQNHVYPNFEKVRHKYVKEILKNGQYLLWKPMSMF